MKEINNISEFQTIIRRRSTNIVCFNDPSDDINQNIIKNVKETCKLFPYVLCYKMDWIILHLYTLTKSLYDSHFVYKYKNRKLDMIASGNSKFELHKLFNYSFQEARYDFAKTYYNLLKNESSLDMIEVYKILFIKTEPDFDRTRPIFTKPPPIRRRIKRMSKKFKSALEYFESYEKVPYSVPTLSQRKQFLGIDNYQKSSYSQKYRMDDSTGTQMHKFIDLNKVKFQLPKHLRQSPNGSHFPTTNK